MKNITVKLVCAASVIIATGYIPVPSDVPSEGFEYKDFLIRQTRLTCESEILILRKRPDDISGRTEIQLSGVSIDNVEALASGESGGKVHCCPDPGDTCDIGNAILHDEDEC